MGYLPTEKQMNRVVRVVNIVLLVAFILITSLGFYNEELQPAIIKYWRIYFVLIIIVQLVSLGVTLLNGYFNPRKEPLNEEEQIERAAGGIWLVIGVALAAAIMLKHFEWIPLFILYLMVTPLMAVAIRWMNQD